MSSLDELIKLWGQDVNQGPEVSENTVREVLEFALTAAEWPASVLSIGTGQNSGRIWMLGHEVHPGVVIVRLLGKEVHPSVHRQTINCLADLAASAENQMKIASCSGVLDLLACLFGNAADEFLKEHTARCLANLAELHENHFVLVNSGLLDPLLNLLVKDGPPKVHKQIARCLTNLGVSKETLVRIASYPGALDALVRLLGKSGRFDVNEQAAKCLATLANLEETQLKIVSGTSGVKALVGLLGKMGVPSVQRQSLKCLTILADHYQQNKEAIASYPGVLNALVRLLKYNWITTGRIRVQVEAAKCLVKLVSAPKNLVKIAFHKDALNALVRCMDTKVRTYKVQNLAAECFKSLAEAPENRGEIVCYPGAVSALKNQLVQDVNPSGQEMAARCLSKLAIAPETKVLLISYPGVLEALVSMLGTSSSLTLYPTVRCLAFLALSQENKVRIASHPGVVDALVGLLRSKLDVPSVEQAVKCLSYLALAHGNVQKILSYPGALAALASLLQEDGSLAVLEYTASCLTSLACSPENQVKISSFPGMLNSLLVLVSPPAAVEMNPRVQEQFVRCLAKLGVTSANQTNIGSGPSPSDALWTLTAEVNSSVQERALLLVNLKLREAAERDLRITYLGNSMQGHGDSPSDPDHWLVDPDHWWVDPITWDIMCDPVKCNDGITYDRWTIIDSGIKRSPYNHSLKTFAIAFDDIDVRKRLFRKFPKQEVKFRSLRESYRRKALQHALALVFENPLNNVLKLTLEIDGAIEMLNNVLKWAPWDVECQNELDVILNFLSEQSSPLTKQPQKRSLVRGDSLYDPDHWHVDPITWDIMCDPVKCNDGFTYDRWTIIDSGIHRSPYDCGLKTFGIACDDNDVRKRLFQIYPEQLVKFRFLRQQYRKKALQHALALEFEDAIEKLSNVLKWAPSDTECQNELGRIQNLFSDQSSSLDCQPEERLTSLYLSENQDHQPLVSVPRAVPVDIDPTPRISIRMLQDRISTIPVIQHGDVIKVREREGRLMVFIVVSLYFTLSFFIS